MNKKSIIIITLIVLLSLISLHIINIKSEQKNEEKSEEKQKNPYVAATSLDELFLKLDLQLKEDDIYEFINSTSCTECMSANFIGEMFDEKISDEFKTIYTISEATWTAFDYDEETMSKNYDYVISLKKDTIVKLAKQIFKDIKIPETIKEDSWYYGINDLTCIDDSCYYSYRPFGITGHVVNGYDIKVNKKNNIATAQTIYVEYGNNLTEGKEADTLTGDITLLDKHKGEIIKKLSSYTFKYETSPDTTNIFDKFSQYYEKTNNYKYIFNEDNVLISVEKE